MTRRNLIPPEVNVHPIFRTLHAKIEESEMSLLQIAKRAGFDSKTIRNWWTGRSTPTLYDLQAVFNAMGYQITVLVLDKDHE